MFKLKTKLVGVLEWFKKHSFAKWLRKRSLVQKFELFGGLAAGLFGLYLLVVFLAVSSGELALAKLKESWEQEKICHEDCARARQEAEKAIMADIKNNLKNLEQAPVAHRLEEYFLAGSSNPKWQEELIKIWRLAAGENNLPSYLKNYLSASSSNPVVQAAIISTFSPQTLSFSSSSDASPLVYYFDLLSGDYDLALKQAAIMSLSNYSDKSQDFSLDQLLMIKNLVLTPATDNRLRQALVLLLSDYYSIFPSESEEILREVYGTDISGDVISRAFAADVLNRHLTEDLVLPEISAAEWQKYYNN
ncbi:MAG: hypothetical protein WC249_01670 [Patescibacteria group bacterium]|jgi:hypothetical protein